MAGEPNDEQQNPNPAPESESETSASDPLDGGTDALLSMFAQEDGGGQDLSLIVALAPEVEIDDLLEELNTVAVALGIKVRRDDLDLAA
jgi:hypothetical protein